MNRNLLKSVGIYAGIGAFVLIGFQNCSQVNFTDTAGTPIQANNDQTGDPGDPGDPGNPGPTPGSTPLDPSKVSLTLTPDAVSVPENQNVIVTVNYQNVSNISYTCKDRVSGAEVISGMISQSGQQVPIKIAQDIHCEAQGTVAGTETPAKAEGDIAVNCGARLKNETTNRCEDFVCKSVVTLDRSQLNNVPSRTIDGVCYAVKMFDAIRNSSSTLTTSQDGDVLSRNHNSGFGNPTQIHNPYSLDSELLEFRLQGPRSVKLSGGVSAQANILVDNFILVGVYPSNVDPKSDLNKYYKAMGTSDSTIADSNGVNTNSIKFIQTLIPLIPFGTGATSTVKPLDITSSVEPAVFHRLDLRALDCGGVRELSDIYLLFQ